MKALRFTAGLLAVAVIGWIVFQIGTLLAAVDTSRRDRAEMREDIARDGRIIDAQQRILTELQRRCTEAEDCTPIASADIIRGTQGLPGTPGIQGPQGRPGRDGRPGAAGAAGSSGAQGATGATGADGAQGPQGEPGPAGPQGEPGPAGPAGAAGTAQPGTYACPDGQYLTGFGVASDGAVTLTCAPAALVQ